MQNFLSAVGLFFARLISLILAILLVGAMVIVLVVFRVEQQMFNPQVYKQALVEENVYERLPDLVAADLHPAVQESTEVDPALKLLTVEDLRGGVAGLVPAADMQAQTELVIDQFFGYLSSNDPILSLSISTATVKERLIGQPGLEMMNMVMRSWNPCNEADNNTWANAPELPDLTTMPLCKPTDDVIEKVQPQLQRINEKMANSLPGTINVAESMPFPPDLRTQVELGRTAIRLSPLLPLLLMALIAGVVVRSVPSLARWWGPPLLISGLISLALGLFARPIWAYVAPTYLVGYLGGQPSSVVAIATSVSAYVIELSATWIAIGAAVIGSVGLIISLYGFSRKETPGAGGHKKRAPSLTPIPTQREMDSPMPVQISRTPAGKAKPAEGAKRDQTWVTDPPDEPQE